MLDDGHVIEDEIAVADAHPLGARPWTRSDYVATFRLLADGVVATDAQDRFLATVERLPALSAAEPSGLTFAVEPDRLDPGKHRGNFTRAGADAPGEATPG